VIYGIVFALLAGLLLFLIGRAAAERDDGDGGGGGDGGRGDAD